ncbi:MAG: 1-acyl-sn-glycerol-3-phosphate acyltransferase [Myxococcota bacterium]
MATRKPSKKATPKKSTPPKAEKPRALGNDPFARGAAVREAKAGAPSAAPLRERPQTPELTTKPSGAKKRPVLQPIAEKPVSTPLPSAARPPAASPARPPVVAPRPSAGPRPHAGSPTAEELHGPTAHAASPIAEELSGPTPHAASPSVVVEVSPHAGAPVAAELDGPTAHAASPSVTVEVAPHAATPVAEELDGPASHAASPEALEASEAANDETPLASPPSTDGASPGVIGGLLTALKAATGLAPRWADVDRWGKDAQLAAALRPLGELLYDKYWRVRVEGAEHLPSGPFIIVANHAGALPLDGPVLHLALRRERPDLVESRWLLEDQIFHAPFLGVLANRLGAVRANPENALRLLAEGRPVIVFPEGFHGLSKPFSERYQLRRFGRGGYVKIALRGKVPIVPAAIIGGEESMPLLGKIPAGALGVEYLPVTLPPLPARWHIRFAEPVSLDGAPDEPEHDLAWVERKNLAIRDQIEAMLTHMLQGREGVF